MKFHGVAMTKAVQQGAQSGFVGQLGAELSPVLRAFRCWARRARSRRMDDFRSYRTDNVYGLAAMFALDLSFAPRTIFAEGRFGQLAGRAISAGVDNMQSIGLYGGAPPGSPLLQYTDPLADGELSTSDLQN